MSAFRVLEQSTEEQCESDPTISEQSTEEQSESDPMEQSTEE